MRGVVLFGLMSLAGCSAWPDVGGPTLAREAPDWPALRPLDDVLSGAPPPQANDETAQALADRAAGLRYRAAILRGNASDLEAMRARLVQ